MNSGYITTDKIKCTLGEPFTVTGEVKKGILPAFTYELILGSAKGEITIKTSLSSEDFKKGIELKLENEFAEHAYPYGEGSMCYLKAVGVREPKIGSKETVEYQIYIKLYGKLLPEFDFDITVDNGDYGDFENYAVKGFSSVTATVKNITNNFGTKTQSVQILGGAFSMMEISPSEEQTEFSQTKHPIENAGELFAAASVINNLNYGSSKTKTKKVYDYKTPTLEFLQEPTRYDDNGIIDKPTTENKNQRHSVRFKGSIVPFKMKDGEKQICKIRAIDNTNVIIKRLDDKAKATVTVTVTDGENGEKIFEYDGMPVFGKDDIGLEIYKAYDILIECTDSSLQKCSLKKRIKTLGTAFHLKKGGKAASFGKYAERDECLDSAWNIHSDKDVEADGDVSGQYFRIKNGIYFSDADGAESFHGVGSGENNLSRGSHNHGNITSDGKIIIGGEIVSNAVLLVDENGVITAMQKLPTSRLEMEDITKASEIMKVSGTPSVGGIATKKLCYADHIHPYNSAWKQDQEFIDLVNGVNTLIELADGGW